MELKPATALPQRSMIDKKSAVGYEPVPNTPQTYNTPSRSLSDAMHALVDHPVYQAAQLVPGLNSPLSMGAYASHIARDMPGHAAVDAVSFVPGAGITRMVPRVMPSLTRGSLTANSMRGSTAANAYGFLDSLLR